MARPAADRLAGILFDKDGTLLDFALTWERAVPAILGQLADGDDGRISVLADAVGFDLAAGRFRPGAAFIAGTTSDYGPAIAAALGVPFDRNFADRINAACDSEGILTLTPIGDIAGLFAALRNRGLALGIATNDTEVSARRQMTALGLDRHLAFIAGYDSGHGAKPAPGMVTAFAATIDVAPARIAMVGDSLHDLRAGRAAGAMTIGVLTGFADADELGDHADHILPSVAELPALLAALDAG
jgi:phosphoglycolate phosphatase